MKQGMSTMVLGVIAAVIVIGVIMFMMLRPADNFELLVSDAPADIADFESLVVTFTDARVFMVGERFEILDISDVSVDLTQVTDEKAESILNASLTTGTYSKIELIVGSVLGIVDGEEVTVTVPSNKLQITKQFTIADDTVTRFVFDINVVKKGNSNEYNLLPVIAESGVVGTDVAEPEVV